MSHNMNNADCVIWGAGAFSTRFSFARAFKDSKYSKQHGKEARQSKSADENNPNPKIPIKLESARAFLKVLPYPHIRFKCTLEKLLMCDCIK